MQSDSGELVLQKLLKKHVLAKQVTSSQKCSKQSEDDENHTTVAYTIQCKQSEHIDQ